MEENKLLIYISGDGHTLIDVKLEDETFWLTQAQICELYHTSKSNVSEHIKHIFEENELEEDSVVRKFRTTAEDSKTYLSAYVLSEFQPHQIFSMEYGQISETAYKPFS